MTLVELLQKNNNYADLSGSGFITDKEYLHQYCSQIYDQLLAPYKDKPIAFLEIGIANGGSLYMWNDYFPNAAISGVDKVKLWNHDTMLKYPRIQPCIANAYSQEFVDTLPELDIVIDDGPHTEHSWYDFLRRYIPKVKKGGLLIIEDIHMMEVLPKFKELVGDLKWAFYDLRGQTGCYDNLVFVVWK